MSGYRWTLDPDGGIHGFRNWAEMENTIIKNMGQKIHEARNLRGWSLRELAKRSKVSRWTITNIENFRHHNEESYDGGRYIWCAAPMFTTAYCIATALGLTMDEFISSLPLNRERVPSEEQISEQENSSFNDIMNQVNP